MADIASLGVSINSTDIVQFTARAVEGKGAADALGASVGKLGGVVTSTAQAQATASATQTRATETTNASASAAERLIAAIAKQRDTYDLADAALAQYNATAAKADAAQRQTIATSAAMVSQLQAENAQRAQYYATTEAATAAGERFIASLRTQAETIGLSKTQLLEYKAAQLGVAEAAAPLIAEIEAQTAALSKAATASVVLGESEAQAAARISDAISASVAQAAVLNDNTIATERYAASVDALAAAETKAKEAQAVSAAPAAASGGRAAAGAAYADELNARTRAQAQAAAGDGEFSATTNKVSDSLERQFLALTASRSQLVAYDADLAGATAVEKEYLVSLAQGIELRQREIALGAEYAAAIKAEAAAAEAGTFANTAFVREIGVIFREISEGRITQAVASFTRLLSVANLLGLVFNPVTIGVAALGYAAIKGAEEVTALNNALITTGNYAGTSAAQLEASANAIGATGERTGVAIEALTKLAATGKFSASQITEIGTAATAASDTTGVALDKIVAEFVKLQGDPVKASAELNSQYHYLTLSVYDQIDALAKQGDAVGAAQAATDAYANALKDRAADSVASLGTIESAWDKVKNATSAAIEAAKGIGKPTTPQDQLAAVNAQIAQDQGATSQYSFRSQRGAGPVQTVDTTSPGISTVPRGATAPTGQQILSGLYQQQSALSTEIGSERNARDLQGSYEQTQATGVQAQQTLDRLHQEYIGRKDVTDALTQQAAALKAVAAAGGTVQPGEGSDLTAAIQKRGQTRTPGAAGLASAEREQPLQDLKDQYDLQNSLNKDQETILDDNHRARLVKDDDFFKQEQILNDQDLANKLSYNTRLVALLTADMNASSTSAKQRVEDQTAIDKAQSASNVAIAGWAAQSTAINDKSVDEANAKTAATQKYIDALNAQILKEQEAADAQLAAAGLGKTQGKQAGFEAQAQTKEQAGVATATSQYLGGQIDTAGFTARVTAQQQAEAQSVAIHQNTTAQLAAADTSWSAGATKAWDNWENQADNTTGQVATATTGFLNGLSDQLLKFAETGKANFQALAESFVSALAKMEVQAAESKVFGLIEQGLTGGTGLTGGGGAIGSLLQALGIGGTSTASLGLAGAGIDSAVTSSTADIASQAGLGLGTQFGALAAGFATGGHITGPGSGTSDSIPARLSNGEFVVNAAATSRNLPLLHSLNGSSGSTPGKTHFADGGVVNTGAGASQGSTNVAFHINQTNSGGQQDTSSQAQAKNAALQKDLQAAVIEIVRKHSQPGGQINQIIRGVSTT